MENLKEHLRPKKESETRFLTVKNTKTGVFYCYRILKRYDNYFLAVLAGGISQRYFQPIGFFTDYSNELKTRKNDDHSKESYFQMFKMILERPEWAENHELLSITDKRALQPY